MNELIKVNYDNDRPLVSARELHEFLEVKSRYNDWFNGMKKYGFVENADYITLTKNLVSGGKENDHQLTIEAAKEICMIQRNDKGKQARQYFIQLEKDWNSPDRVMARALQIADKQIKSLQAANAQLAVDKQIMQPKADYFDELVDRNLLTNFRETAKELCIKERRFIKFLLENKYIYRDKKGKLLPYAAKNDGLFEIKECYNESTQWSGTQTLITPKGRETFRLLIPVEVA